MLTRSFACALLTLVLVQRSAPVHAICRVVEPVEERGGVWFDPNTLALYVVAPEQVVGHVCAPLPVMPASEDDCDAGGAEDSDAGSDNGGLDDDSGVAVADGEPSSEPIPASACPVGEGPVPVRGPVIHMAVQPAVLTGGGRAGLVMPVPARPDIHAAPHDLFLELGALLEPEIVTTTEYVEDESLGYQCQDPKFTRSSPSGGGCLGGDSDDDAWAPVDAGAPLYDPGTEDGVLEMAMIGDGIVRFEEALSTEDYDVTVLSATTLDALRGWLDENGFGHDAEDDTAFASYVAEGAWFVALEVHPPANASEGRGLAPLVASWRGERVPVLNRLQYHTLGGEITTEAFVMASNRMEVADDSGETLYAAEAHFGATAQAFGLAQGWLTHLRMTRRLAEWKEDSFLRVGASVVVRPVLERVERIRIPSSECPAGGTSRTALGCGSCATRGNGPSADFGAMVLGCAWLLVRARRQRRS